jgi:enterochelin esterase family protein
LVWALLFVAPAAAQMPAPRAMLHSKFIDDCGPKILPDELCRLPVAFEADEAEMHLGGKDLVYWIEGQTLNIAARAFADEAVLEGSIEEGMTPLSTRRPLWGAAYRLTAIDKSILELTLRGHPGAKIVYRGPNAPPVPPSNDPLLGHLERIDIMSGAMGARQLQVYVPPGKAPAGGWPVVIAAGIDDIGPYAAIADALIQQHQTRPVALVSLGAGEGQYLRGRDPDAFIRHNMFVHREALPLVEKRFHLASGAENRMLWGIGAGGDWALDTVARDASAAAQVAAFSPPGLSEFPFRNRKLKLYLQAGAYEPPYLKGARTTCNLAGASNATCRLDITDSGHAPLIWQAEWAKVLKEAFPAARAQAAKR